MLICFLLFRSDEMASSALNFPDRKYIIRLDTKKGTGSGV